ncbi:MAG: hypothetical protein HFE90_02410 [Firmicutes bacterium]|nr:hypothetical protein [Bacillota bacterium]
MLEKLYTITSLFYEKILFAGMDSLFEKNRQFGDDLIKYTLSSGYEWRAFVVLLILVAAGVLCAVLWKFMLIINAKLLSKEALKCRKEGVLSEFYAWGGLAIVCLLAVAWLIPRFRVVFSFICTLYVIWNIFQLIRCFRYPYARLLGLIWPPLLCLGFAYVWGALWLFILIVLGVIAVAFYLLQMKHAFESGELTSDVINTSGLPDVIFQDGVSYQFVSDAGSIRYRSDLTGETVEITPASIQRIGKNKIHSDAGDFSL